MYIAIKKSENEQCQSYCHSYQNNLWHTLYSEKFQMTFKFKENTLAAMFDAVRPPSEHIWNFRGLRFTSIGI